MTMMTCALLPLSTLRDVLTRASSHVGLVQWRSMSNYDFGLLWQVAVAHSSLFTHCAWWHLPFIVCLGLVNLLKSVFREGSWKNVSSIVGSTMLLLMPRQDDSLILKSVFRPKKSCGGRVWSKVLSFALRKMPSLCSRNRHWLWEKRFSLDRTYLSIICVHVQKVPSPCFLT